MSAASTSDSSVSRLNKLRQAPLRFFADSRVPLLRRGGAPLGAYVESSPALLGWLESPRDRLEELAGSSCGAPARFVVAREKAARAATIEAHGGPKVAVIVPAKDSAATLEASVRSLLAQSYTNLEIILVDDGSQDGTWALMQHLAKRDARVRALRNGHTPGAAGARNCGMEAATASHLTFHDSDDRSAPERIERQLAALLAGPRDAVVVCSYKRVAHDGTKVIVNGRHFARSIISMMFHRSLLDRSGPMKRLHTGEDAEFFERLLASGGGRMIYLDQVLYFALFRPNSLLFSTGSVEYAPGGHVRFERR